jgi:hypothetical protein
VALTGIDRRCVRRLPSTAGAQVPVAAARNVTRGVSTTRSGWRSCVHQKSASVRTSAKTMPEADFR